MRNRMKIRMAILTGNIIITASDGTAWTKIVLPDDRLHPCKSRILNHIETVIYRCFCITGGITR